MVEPENQFMSAAATDGGGCMHGHNTSNAAESMQHACMIVRKQASLYRALHKLMAEQKPI